MVEHLPSEYKDPSTRKKQKQNPSKQNSRAQYTAGALILTSSLFLARDFFFFFNGTGV
jgi:hypothetical protein